MLTPLDAIGTFSSPTIIDDEWAAFGHLWPTGTMGQWTHRAHGRVAHGPMGPWPIQETEQMSTLDDPINVSKRILRVWGGSTAS